MSLIINRENFPDNKRILVTSDIHGHADRLRRVLEASDFSDDDILVIVGDMIDKGPESLKTLQLIMKLSEKGNVRALAGNNDMWRLLHMDYLSADSAQSFYDYLLHNRKWYGSSIFDDMAQEIGMYPESPEKLPEIRDAVYERFSKEIEFIRRLPTILETQNFIFVHGGLPSKDLDNLQVRDIYGVLSIGSFYKTELSFDKFVVVGHFPVDTYNDSICQLNPLIDTKRKIISIDGGCGVRFIGDKELEAKESGQLNLLVIPNINCSPETITSIYTDDFPVVIAKDAQKASDTSSYFHWQAVRRLLFTHLKIV